MHPGQRGAMRKDFALRDRAFETARARRWREQNEAREREQQEAAEAAQQREIEREALTLKADLAWVRFELAMVDLALRQKANFNPNQPRVPKGSGIESGRWSGPGIGHNQGPPLRDLPKIPKKPPPTSGERTSVAKQVARWLARGAVALAMRHPVGLAAVVAATGAV